MRRTRSQKESDQNRRPAAPASAAPRQSAPLAELQRAAGNEVVNHLLDAHIQTKLLVGSVDDPAERQADRVAEAVLRRLGQSGTPDATPSPGPDTTVEVDAAGGEVTAATERAIAGTGGGSPLPSPVRRAMEGAFGADLEGVRLHTGAEATELNQRLQSRAFTFGSDIFFRDAAPDLASREGQGLLAHELAHTIQQGATAARAPADAQRVVRRGGPATASGTAGTTSGAGSTTRLPALDKGADITTTIQKGVEGYNELVDVAAGVKAEMLAQLDKISKDLDSEERTALAGYFAQLEAAVRGGSGGPAPGGGTTPPRGGGPGATSPKPPAVPR